MSRKSLLYSLIALIITMLFTACVPVEQVSEQPVEQKETVDNSANQQQINMKMSFAQEHYKNKNYTEAIPLYKEVIETLDPENATAYKYLAYSYIRLEDKQYIDSALTVFNTAAAKYPDKKFPYSGLGYVFLKSSVYDSAAYYYAEAVSRDTTDSKNILSLAQLLINEKLLDSALVTLEMGSRHAPDEADIWLRLTDLYSLNRDYPGQVTAYENLHRIDSANPEYLLELGQAYAHNGDTEKALSMLNDYVAGNPDDYLGYKYLGLVNSVKGNYSEAEVNLKKAIDLKSNDAKLECDLATVYTEAGQLSKAQQCLNKASQFDKNFARIYVVRGDIVSKIAYGMAGPEGELDYCAKAKFEEAYNIYRSALSDSKWGAVAKRRMDSINDYRPSSEEKAAWKHLGKSCD